MRQLLREALCSEPHHQGKRNNYIKKNHVIGDFIFIFN